jgi:hypothetical protein
VTAIPFVATLFFASPPFFAYAAVVALAFHLFVVVYEEPTLRRQFGADYETTVAAGACRQPRRAATRPTRVAITTAR